MISIYFTTASILLLSLAFLSFDLSFARRVTNKMSRVTRDAANKIITLHPAEGLHTATIVLMHGLGDSGEGIKSLADAWSRDFPHVKFIMPTAESRPLKLFGGRPTNAWYDVLGLPDKRQEPCTGLDISTEKINAIVHHEHSQGLPYSRIVLAGFSQGGSMSLYTGLQLTTAEEGGAAPKLAGLLVMSGFLPGINQFQIAPGLHDTPILHLHGTADTMVDPGRASFAHEHVTSQGATDYTLKWYPGAVHTITREMLADADAFLKKVLPVEYPREEL